jgi:hypothetical protein
MSPLLLRILSDVRYLAMTWSDDEGEHIAPCSGARATSHDPLRLMLKESAYYHLIQVS